MKTLSLIILLFMSSVINSNQAPVIPVQLKASTEAVIAVPELNKKNLTEFLISIDAQHKDIIYKQIMCESGHLNSKLTRTHNNITGMRCAKQREHCQSGCQSKYAIYSNWQQCVLDYIKLQKNYTKGRILSKQDYYTLLSRKYAQANNYIRILKRIKVPRELT